MKINIYQINHERDDKRLMFFGLNEVQKDEEKTEKQFFVDGINCNPSTARDQFITTKEYFGKTDGIQAYHGYMSFKEQDITPEKAQEVGMEFASRAWGKRFQVVVTCHLNTQHLHCHFVINSISFVDGKRMVDNEKNWFKFRHIADAVCKEYGLHFNPNPKFERPTNYYFEKLEKAGMPNRYQLIRDAINHALEHSKSVAEVGYALRDMGYGYDFNPRRKYWTVKPPGYTKSIRLNRVGDDYTREAILRRLQENRSRVGMHRYTQLTVVSRQYRLPTRGDKIRKIGGLYGLYLYYCYRLGKLPSYRKLNSAQIHYYFKEELLKLDELSEQTRRAVNMTNGGDAAEMLVRLYLEGFEEVVKLSGKGIKELVPLLASTLKQESKSKGKARLTQMIKSGSPLKVFTFKNKDLKKFTEQAKRYGVLYTVLRDKNSKEPNATVDVIARAEDASKIQRIADRFEFSKVDKASIVKEVEKSSISTTSKNYIINYQDLQGIGMTDKLTLPTLIALCSIALGKPAISSLAVLGDISIAGTLIKVENLASTLQVCLDSGAKKVLLPITAAVDLSTVPSELIGCFNIIFYKDPEDAVFKALGVE